MPDVVVALIVAASITAYLTIGAFAARAHYALERARRIEKELDSPFKPDVAKAVADFDQSFRDLVTFAAVFVGVTWPVSVPVKLIHVRLARWFDETAPKSRAELEAEHAVMRERIRELERELRIAE